MARLSGRERRTVSFTAAGELAPACMVPNSQACRVERSRASGVGLRRRVPSRKYSAGCRNARHRGDIPFCAT